MVRFHSDSSRLNSIFIEIRFFNRFRVTEIRQYITDPLLTIILLGLKTDLREDKSILERLREKNLSPVTFQQGFTTAKQLNLNRYMECSCLTQIGLKDVIDESIRLVVRGGPPAVVRKARTN